MKLSIKKIIVSRITQGSIVAFLFMAVMVFAAQWTITQDSLVSTANVRISDAKERLEQSEENIDELTSQLNEEFLVKARAFAEMIELSPDFITDSAKLDDICRTLDVDELHVTDEEGVIQWTTIPPYVGFDMSSSDQAKPFMKCISDNTYELAQDPQPNGAEGRLFQYIGVGRKDKPGIVQIGMEPVRLSEAIKDNQIDVILSDIVVGANGTMYAVNKADGTIAAFSDSSYIGKKAEEAGITEKLLSKQSKKSSYVRIDGKLYFTCVSEYGDYYIGTLNSVSEVTHQTVTTTIIIMIMTAVIIFILLGFVTSATNKHVIASLRDIENTLVKISGGDKQARLNVRNCYEFDIISNGFNDMIDSVEQQIVQTNNVNNSMEKLLSDVYSTSQSIYSHSEEMKGVSEKISVGSVSQESTVTELNEAFQSITKDAADNAEAANEASKFSRAAGEQLKAGAEKMNNVKDAMKQITDYSHKIGNIINTIEDIAFQTNILALNAAVEAARAGAAGKGFAVVADEVRNLATKSAEAANSTAKLITDTLEAVKYGNVTANSAAEELDSMTEGINKSIELIAEISAASAKQAESVSRATNGMERISEIARSNSDISQSAKETADMLDTQAEKLIALVESK